MYNNYLTNIDFNVGIYIRLSQEDKGKLYESDSESVINQKELLKNYVKSNYFNLVDEYVDDGYTGTNFDRPGFQKLLEDIKSKKINCVIVKDLSRLGRDHVLTGYYIETFFPENNVRFISILESYDSFKNQASNDSSTFIIACNDYYSKQNSIKIRNVLNNKRKDGKFIGSKPSFGYIRDPNDKGHLIIDPNTSFIVKEIFDLRANGIGPSEITTILNNKKYITPSKYKETSYSSRQIKNDIWNISSVKKILKNRIYTGDMVQHTQTKINYKSKKKISLDKSLWVIVENTHEAIIDKTTFDYVQKLSNTKTRYRNPINREKRLLEGKLICNECKNSLSVLYRKNKDYWTVNCNKYSRDPKRRLCEPHFFPYNYLEEQILDEFKKVISKYINKLDIDELNKELIKNIKNNNIDINSKIKELETEKESTLNKIKSLYNDKFNNIISNTIYKELTNPLELRLKDLTNNIENLKIELETKKNKIIELPDYTKKIKELLDLNKKENELIETLIDKILIDKDKNITLIFKYDVINNHSFKYKEINKIRNPYGRKGKQKNQSVY